MDPNPNSVIMQKLVPFIQDAYALENQIVSTLEAHAEEARAFPAVQAKILEHLEQTRQHRERMAGRLEAYGQHPSAVKDALSGVLGNMLGAVSALRPDTLARNARDEYVTEHLEIAGYTLLITTARALGDSAHGAGRRVKSARRDRHASVAAPAPARSLHRGPARRGREPAARRLAGHAAAPHRSWRPPCRAVVRPSVLEENPTHATRRSKSP